MIASGRSLADSIERRYLDLIKRWNLPICYEPNREEKILAASVLDRYLSELGSLAQPRTARILLPSNFETYAHCVLAILQSLSSWKPSRPGTIRVSTILAEGLERWYNISREELDQSLQRKTHDPRAKRCVFTRPHWENYKQLVKNIRTQGLPSEHSIQMRRIVLRKEEHEIENRCYVYATKKGEAITLEDAKPVRPPACLCFLEDVKNTIDHPSNAKELYLIALHNPAEARGKGERKGREKDCQQHPGWVRLREHFEITFHDQVHCHRTPVGPEDKGVYCSFPPQVCSHLYDDLFIADMSAVSGGRFGIAYYKSRAYEVSGIVFLSNEEIEQQRSVLDGLWSAAGAS